jgi:hypothetical protein
VRTVLFDALVIALLAAVLIGPLFKLEYLDNWGSIESTFIADGRFLADHWPHPLWQPLWYGGTRFDYVYPPAIRYGTAALARTASIPPVRAYHIFTALLYAVGIAGVYVLIRTGSGSRRGAWLGAAATALVSPSFLLMAGYRADSVYLVPQRLNVLLKYGEGPHISALSLLPLALAAAFYGLRRGRTAMVAIAAILSALVALTNFYGATSLAMLFAILVWSVWITHRDPRVWLRAAAIAALAYGLTAFWLVPSYLRITLANLAVVSADGTAASSWTALGLAGLFAAASWRFAAGRKESAYVVFACGAAFLFGAIVAGHYFWNLRLVGNPARFVPELDLALILFGVEGLRLLWRRRTWLARALAVLCVAGCLFFARHYLRHAWNIYPADSNYRERVEYRTADWVAKNLPGSHVFVMGSIRFWYDVWHDLPLVGGGSDQGVLNPNIMRAHWDIAKGPDPRAAILWLTAFGADAIAVSDQTSEEVYHDFTNPKNFATLPVLHDGGKGVVIYRVPRRFPALARVVDRARAAALEPVRRNFDVERLQPYVDVLESGPESPVAMSWEGTDAIRLRARVAADQCLIVQVTYDPAWHAYAGGRPVTVRKDAIGQMLVYPPPGEDEVQLVFGRPVENTVGWILTWTSIAIAAAVTLRRPARSALQATPVLARVPLLRSRGRRPSS